MICHIQIMANFGAKKLNLHLFLMKRKKMLFTVGLKKSIKIFLINSGLSLVCTANQFKQIYIRRKFDDSLTKE